MRRGLVLLALAIVCLLAGCTAWMGGSYASVTPHAEGYAQTEPVDTAVASSQKRTDLRAGPPGEESHRPGLRGCEPV